MVAGNLNLQTDMESKPTKEYECSCTVCPPPRVQETTTQTICRRNFRRIDACILVVSLMAYTVHTLTDVVAGIEYLQNGELTWGLLTYTLLLAPALIVQAISVRWYEFDGKMHGWKLWIIHICQMEPLERYMSTLVAGVQAARSDQDADSETFHNQQSDLCILRLFQTCLHSAPQLTVQLYVLLYTTQHHWLTGPSACLALLAIGVTAVAHAHSLRKSYCDQDWWDLPALFLQAMCHIGSILARALAIAAFCSAFYTWIFLFLGLHWVGATIWVLLQQTSYCLTTVEERLFNLVQGLVYCFSYINLKEGQSRWRVAAFYTIMFMENTVLVLVWYAKKTNIRWHDPLILATIFGAFFLGLGCILIYYRFCHPKGPIHWHTVQDHDIQTPLKGTYVSKHSIVSLVPRKSLMKSLSSCSTPIQLRAVAIDSHLSPIREPEREQSFYTKKTTSRDQSLSVDRTPQCGYFQHFSIDNSACMQHSRCGTLDASGIDLTGIMENLPELAGSSGIKSPSQVQFDQLVQNYLSQTDNMSKGSQDKLHEASDLNAAEVQESEHDKLCHSESKPVADAVNDSSLCEHSCPVDHTLGLTAFATTKDYLTDDSDS